MNIQTHKEFIGGVPAVGAALESVDQSTARSVPPPMWPAQWDALSGVTASSSAARGANRALLLGLALFALAVPHSVAAAHISLDLSLAAWVVRDAALRRLHFTRTPLDLPLLCFAVLTIISALLSLEPGLSLPKLKTLTLFGIVYLCATNLNRRGALLLTALLIASSLVGVGFGLWEKARGRGMIIASIAADSPLAASKLVIGDVIWMIAKQRVNSPAEAAHVIRWHRPGETLTIEAAHEGDPIPATLTVTAEMQARANPLGAEFAGRSRKFRLSGFARQFLTYAEQMQIFALLSLGALLVFLRRRQQPPARVWWPAALILFGLYACSLVFTASRAVMASFLTAVVLVSLLVGGRRAPLLAALLAVTLGGLSFFVIVSTRPPGAAGFGDDSTVRRLAYMRAGLRVIPQHPLFGVGMDAHNRHAREWGFPADYVSHTHSTPIQIALDRGLPALLCYLWLTATMMLMLRRDFAWARGRGDTLNAGLTLGALGALLAFSVSSLVNYNFGDSEVLMLLLAVMSLAHIAARSPAQGA